MRRATRVRTGLLGRVSAVAVGQALPPLTAIVVTPALLATLGLQGFGLYSLIVSGQVLTSLTDLGTANTLLTEVPKAVHRRDRSAVVDVVRHAVRVACTAAVVLLLLGAAALLAGPSLARSLATDAASSTQVARAVAVLCLALGLSVVGTVALRLRQAQGHEISAWLTVGGVGAAAYGSLPLLAWAGAGVEVLVAATVLPPALGRLALWPAALHEVHALPVGQPTEVVPALGRSLGRQSGLYAYLQVTSLVAYQLDQFVLSVAAGLEAVAEYAIVARVAGAAFLVCNAIATPVWPRLAAAAAARDGAAMRHCLRFSFTASLGAATVMLVLVAALGDVLWSSLSSGTFLPSTGLLVGFGLAVVLRAVDSTTAVFLNAIPVIRFQVVVATLVLVTNPLCSFVLSARYGASGAVWGTVLTQAPLVTAPYLLRMRRHLPSRLD